MYSQVRQTKWRGKGLVLLVPGWSLVKDDNVTSRVIIRDSVDDNYLHKQVKLHSARHHA